MMTHKLCIALAQLNQAVGDIDAAVKAIRAARAIAATGGADLLILPELALIGYPPEDLVRKPAFQQAAAQALETLAHDTADGGPALLVGTCWPHEGALYNALVLLEGGRIADVRYKHALPNYGVFDEQRTFTPGPLPQPLLFRGVALGLPICEDIWSPTVCAHLVTAGAELLLVANGSPYEIGKDALRQQIIQQRVGESGLPLAYVNRIGGQDELVFDGGTQVVNADGTCALRLPDWQEAVVLTHWQRAESSGRWSCAPGPSAPPQDRLEGLYNAMVTGLRDYVTRNRFPGVLLGLSGGIDSALSAAVAVDALGADKVWCVMMPSRYTSQDSLDDALACARMLGVRLDTVAITPGVAALAAMTAPLFAHRAPDLTEENIQSRLRGVTLMALSNKFGPMVLTTGNKSELSVGYATLYGDMCGGYNVLKDLYKTTVFKVSHWRNHHHPAGAHGPDGPVMPERILTKAPSAELRDNQRDDDSLPPYDVLDALLRGLVEEELGAEALIAAGADPALVMRVENLLYTAEYKRRQSPPGVKLSTRSFGRDRRYPITHGFRSL